MPDRFDLGRYVRKVTTGSEHAQRWFNLGLNWCYGFNQEEGVKCFLRALEADPSCAMAHWGVAYGTGPFYNLPWRHLGVAEAARVTRLCHEHSRKALEMAGSASAAEADLIEALTHRFGLPEAVAPDEFDRWDDAYADAMRKVYEDYPDDLDVIALYAEALMTRTPWKLWDTARGVPATGADTAEAIEALDRAITLSDERGEDQHPAILHLHIHALEMSPQPEEALESADQLGELCPDAGHMNHMPGHIYAQCGLYDKAKWASEKAIRADRMFADYAGNYTFYTTARAHDLHLMMSACMFLGQYAPAKAAADEMCAVLSPDVLTFDDRPQMTATMEGYHSMYAHVLVRFGKWAQIAKMTLPDDRQLYCVSTAMILYAKVVAFAALGRFSEADRAKEDYFSARERISADREFFNNKALDILGVAEAMFEGELAYHRGETKPAFRHLRTAVERCDDLAFSEPWPWMHPPRHALGALLCAEGQYEEAEEVYRADLGLNATLQRCCQNPGNVWSMHGLAECLRQRAAYDELESVKADLARASALTDGSVTSSCCCRKSAPPP
ncbi:MAG: hypothetical protein AAF441_10310 [Pseudomonadota bacterium]